MNRRWIVHLVLGTALVTPACRDDGAPDADGGDTTQGSAPGDADGAPDGSSGVADPSDDGVDTTDSGGPSACEPAGMAPVPDPLLWKRRDAFDADLRGALMLEADEVCNEIGSLPCRDVHRIPLGANEPFDTNLYRPVAEPLATTPIAMERVVMAACTRRVQLDTLGPPLVFTALDLGAAEPTPTDEAIGEHISQLYRRLLARSPSTEEVDILAELAQDTTPAQFAVLTCFAIGTTTEAATF